jgi:mono/diheme cytochrome c family protein
MRIAFSLSLPLAVVVACSSSSQVQPAEPSQPSSGGSLPAQPAAASDPVAAQVARGKDLYVARCAKCHGDGGQGTKEGPPVVGAQAFPLQPRAGSKRDAQFKTAADVFAWTAKNMPGDDPGSLTTEELLAVFAFDLTANGVKLTAPLDTTAAAAIVLHP